MKTVFVLYLFTQQCVETSERWST